MTSCSFARSIMALISRATLLLLAAPHTLRAQAPDLVPHGRVVVDRMSAPALHDPRRAVRVYLPPGYELAENAERRYPVVYLLHGWPGGDSDWDRKGRAAATLDSMIADRRIPPVIAVMPSGRGDGLLGRSLYVNSHDGRVRMEDFLAREVVAWVDSSFRTLADARDRGIIGLSDGGEAAMNLALKHPDVFGACASHSGGFRLRRGIGEGRILGQDPGAERILEENSPLDYVDQVAPRLGDTVIYFDCGQKDGELRDNLELDRRLDALHVAHAFREFPGGHRWSYWRLHLHDSLAAVTSRMSGV